VDARDKPLGHKAYLRIPHLPGSRTGRRDRHLPVPLAQRLLVTSSPGDTVVVQEKLDGSCVAIAKLDGQLIALGREGVRAHESANPGRQLFARWVDAHAVALAPLLAEREWVVGEWLALAHGTRYSLTHAPFVPFDLFTAAGALTLDALTARVVRIPLLRVPHLVHRGAAIGIEPVLQRLGTGGHGADSVEGAVWRLERDGQVVVRAKYVRAEKVDGHLLPENSGEPAIWNWRP
jgi:RNA ligase